MLNIDEIVDTIICGDCLEIMKQLPDKCIDLVLTDPPYFLPAQHYQTRKRFKRNFSDLGILETFYKLIFEQIERIIKDNGSIYWFCDGQSYSLFYYYLYFFTKSLRPLIWDKVNAFNGYGWRHQHELIIWAEMPESKPIRTGDGDIIRIAPVKIDDRQHPAEKPIELFKKLIDKSTEKDTIVIDPFIGGGGSAVAAIELGRRFIGVELSPEYYAIANKRIAAAKAQCKLELGV